MVGGTVGAGVVGSGAGGGTVGSGVVGAGVVGSGVFIVPSGLGFGFLVGFGAGGV